MAQRSPQKAPPSVQQSPPKAPPANITEWPPVDVEQPSKADRKRGKSRSVSRGQQRGSAEASAAAGQRAAQEAAEEVQADDQTPAVSGVQEASSMSQVSERWELAAGDATPASDAAGSDPAASERSPFKAILHQTQLPASAERQQSAHEVTPLAGDILPAGESVAADEQQATHGSAMDVDATDDQPNAGREVAASQPGCSEDRGDSNETAVQNVIDLEGDAGISGAPAEETEAARAMRIAQAALDVADSARRDDERARAKKDEAAAAEIEAAGLRERAAARLADQLPEPLRGAVDMLFALQSTDEASPQLALQAGGQGFQAVIKTFESYWYSQKEAGASAAELDLIQSNLQVTGGTLRDWDKQLSELRMESLTSGQALDLVFSAVDKLGDKLVKLPRFLQAQAVASGSAASSAAPSAAASGPTAAASGGADAGTAQHVQEEAQIDEMAIDSREGEADFDRTVRQW